MSRTSLLCARLSLVLLLGVASCGAPRRLSMPSLASARVVGDYETYEIQRVGLLPFEGAGLSSARRSELQLAFYGEVSQSTPYEIVLLEAGDLDEVESSEPYRRGWYNPRTLIEIAKRFQLDAVFFGTVPHERFFPPQLFSLQVDLVSAETGLVIWTGNVHLDASDERVVDGLKVYYGMEEDENWKLALLSPERFARFAAFQVACLL